MANPESPWTWECWDSQGRRFAATFTFNQGNGALAACRIDRDPGCSYDVLLIGVGPDGRPDSAVSAVRAHGQGVTVLAPLDLAAIGLNTITDVLATQITAGL